MPARFAPSRKRPVSVFREKRVAVVLGRPVDVGHLLGAGPGVGHRVLVLLVGRRLHVGDEKVDQPVVVHVAEVGPHR